MNRSFDYITKEKKAGRTVNVSAHCRDKCFTASQTETLRQWLRSGSTRPAYKQNKGAVQGRNTFYRKKAAKAVVSKKMDREDDW